MRRDQLFQLEQDERFTQVSRQAVEDHGQGLASTLAMRGMRAGTVYTVALGSKKKRAWISGNETLPAISTKARSRTAHRTCTAVPTETQGKAGA